MGLYDSFLKYRDKFGLNQLYSNGISGDTTQNGVLFTLEYLICLLSDPNTPQSTKEAEILRLIKVYESLEIFPGVTIRLPGEKEFDSMDNTGAIATFSGLFDEGRYSKRSLKHGKETRATGIDLSQRSSENVKLYKYAWILSGFRAPRYFWNNNDKNLFCFFGWHGRSPSHMAFLKLTAGKCIGPLSSTYILLGQFLGCFKSIEDTDARKLSYLNWQLLKKRSLFWKLAYKLWCFVLMKQYPEGMKTVYSMYYADPNHPIRAYSKKFEP